jgi:electron transfer flavoprotein beta subunit
MQLLRRKDKSNMEIVTCFKVVPDDQDITINSDDTLNYSKARPIVSTYDLNAIEAAAVFAAANGANMTALTIGPADIDESKLKKNVLARGPEALYMVADDALAGADTFRTASILAAALGKVGAFDLVVCGDGSADMYTQQVGVQLGEMLGLPTVNAVSSFALDGGALVVERTLEDEIETLQVPLPAVISVTSDAALPRICAMKEILAAGKKPMEIWTVADLGAPLADATLDVLDIKAPKPAPRKKEIFDDSDAGITDFLKKVTEALR